MIQERGPPRILIVEDGVFIALDEESLVRSAGCEVAGPVARLGDARRIIDTDRIDGALLDVNLNGKETSIPLAVELERRAIPFLFVTGMAGDLVSQAFPGIPVIRKPYQPAILRAAIKRMTGRN
jgi:DNA-binding response OmpR family regulator